MTEDEAKTKWCPFVRATPSDEHGKPFPGPSHNRVGLSPIGRCIVSACMAWRWRESENQPSHLGYADDGTPDDPRAQGFCGLAGRP